MSTDSTELTFVRCPSCRSLVPAVSTRCRMCGATLDAAVKPEEEQKRSSGRVRQRTMSQPHSQLSATASQIRQDMAGDEEADPFEAGEAAEADIEAGDDNPLGQYLQEDDLEVLGSGSEEDFDDTFAEAPAAEPEAPKQAAPAVEESKPKVTVETGPRQMGKPSSLSFSKGKDDAAQRPAERADNRGQQEARGGGGRERDRQQADSRREQDQRRDRDQRRDKNQRDGGQRDNRERDNRERDNRDDERQSHERRRDNRPGENAREQQSNFGGDQRAAQKGPAAMQTSGQNRLVGWLVSFDEARGSAVELREGKFFITGSSLKSSDLVIAGKNVSTPHALVTVSAGQGVRIQDLMSESGLYVRRKQKSDFQREEGTITVSHGDSVKFGDAEYNIALIDAGN